jgi:hypothetical protein
MYYGTATRNVQHDMELSKSHEYSAGFLNRDYILAKPPREDKHNTTYQPNQQNVMRSCYSSTTSYNTLYYPTRSEASQRWYRTSKAPTATPWK